jgi:hypothetical protein
VKAKGRLKGNILSMAADEVLRAQELEYRFWLHRVGLMRRWREEWKDRAEGTSVKARARALEVMVLEAVGG